MYLDTKMKNECFGCEACVQCCGKNAISLQEDVEGFRYPSIDDTLCVDCGLCRTICPFDKRLFYHNENKYVFGGYNLDSEVRFESTSGGAFSALVDTFCDNNYVIFGAESNGLFVYHSYTCNKKEIWKYRQSKYSQSYIGSSYIDVKRFLNEGKKVLFSGTPCQISGLVSFLENVPSDRLLTVEVICEGVPSPLYMKKLDEFIVDKYGYRIKEVDYRYSGNSLLLNGKWDFQIMRLLLEDGQTILSRDRWFNPFWTIWLNHLMSRPSCYNCCYATADRVADISLGDLWGVHKYCPELYGKNGGSSLIIGNTAKGTEAIKKAQSKLFGHNLCFEEAIKYQSPLRKTIDYNSNRNEFMMDLESSMDYMTLVKKWSKRPSVLLLFKKYIYGNRQKVFVWNIRNRVATR